MDNKIIFELDEEETQKSRDWLKQHNQHCILKDKTTTIGDKISYKFTPTGIGIFISIECACGATEMLTNFDEI